MTLKKKILNLKEEDVPLTVKPIGKIKLEETRGGKCDQCWQREILNQKEPKKISTPPKTQARVQRGLK